MDVSNTAVGGAGQPAASASDASPLSLRLRRLASTVAPVHELTGLCIALSYLHSLCCLYYLGLCAYVVYFGVTDGLAGIALGGLAVFGFNCFTLFCALRNVSWVKDYRFEIRELYRRSHAEVREACRTGAAQRIFLEDDYRLLLAEESRLRYGLYPLFLPHARFRTLEQQLEHSAWHYPLLRRLAAGQPVRLLPALLTIPIERFVQHGFRVHCLWHAGAMGLGLCLPVLSMLIYGWGDGGGAGPHLTQGPQPAFAFDPALLLPIGCLLLFNLPQLLFVVFLPGYLASRARLAAMADAFGEEDAGAQHE